MRNIWATRLLTFFLWLLAAASVGYWLLQTTTRSKPSPALARADLAGGAPAAINPNTLAVAYALGAVGSPPSRTAIALGNTPDGSWDIKRFRLSGIMAQGSVKDGLVVLSIDGKPAEVLPRFVADTGTPALPPEWSFGVWISGNGWNCDAEVDAQLSALAQHRYPASVLVLSFTLSTCSTPLRVL